MSRTLKLLQAFSIWATGSVVLLIVCALSVNQAIITAALALVAGTVVDAPGLSLTCHCR
jgi:hypothetical protein